MKAVITVADDQGKEFTAVVDLVPVPSRTNKPHAASSGAGSRRVAKDDLDFGLSCRAFAKKHVSKALSGEQKFVILTAWIAKGTAGTEISVDDVAKHWGAASGLMNGKFQRVYATRAKDNGWVDTPRRGVYVLGAGWMSAFRG